MPKPKAFAYDPSERNAAVIAVADDIRSRSRQTGESIESILSGSICMTIAVNLTANSSLSQCANAVDDFLAAYKLILVDSQIHTKHVTLN
jgi:hypothetical protein